MIDNLKNIHLPYRRSILIFGMLLSVLLVIFYGSFNNSASALLSQDDVNNMLPNGYDYLKDLDFNAYNNVNTPSCRGRSNYRNCINNASYLASYTENVWLSLDNGPSGPTNQSEITINPGVSTINLRLSVMTFIHNTLLRRGSINPSSDCNLDINYVLGYNGFVDGLPGPRGGSCRMPARTGTNKAIYSINTNPGMVVNGFSPGATLNAPRDDNSRFWRGQSATFSITGNFTSDTDIAVVVGFKSIVAYGSNYQCQVSGNVYVNTGSWSNFSQCMTEYTSFTIKAKVNPQWRLSANTSVDKSTSKPGDIVTWTHSVTNDGPSDTSQTGETIVSRYQNVNSGATNDWDDGTRDNNYGLFRARADRNYCIDVQDGSVSFGARVRSLSCNGTGAQLFRPFPVDNSIRNAKSNLCLDVPSGSGAGTMIKLHGCNGSRAQRFVYDSNSGEIRYTDGSGNILCLDRVGNQYWDGDLQVWNCNGLDNQKWIIDNAARTYDPSWRGVNNPGATGSEGQDYMSAGATRTFNSSYVIKQDDVGKVLCRRTNATGSSYDYNNWLYGPSACTNIPYNYKVTPTTRADKTDMKLGDTVNFTYSLNNQGPTKSQAMQYRAYAFILKQGQTIDTSGPKTYSTFTAAQCGGRGVSATLTKYCTGVATGSGVIIGSGVNPYFNLNVAYDVNSSSIVTNTGSWNVDPGDKVCSYVAVDSWSSSSSLIDQIVASNIQCVGIDKNPQLQIRGADSWSGGIWTNQDGTKYSGNGGFQGYSQSIPERGSWSQYGLLADKGPISGFGSAGYTASLPTLNQINGCKLIFANVISGTSCPNTGGSLNSGSSIMHSIDLPRVAYMTDSELRSRALDINDNSIKALNTQYVDLSTITSGVYLVNGDESETASDVTVGGSLSDNVHVTLIFRKDAYVYFDITTQSSTFSDISKIPSLNLIANNFYFISNDMLEVTNIYGTYIARDSFHSAYSAEPGGESKYMSATGDYASQLKINGAIISKNSPRFQRTLGGGKSSTNITTNDETHTDAATAAEIINYQPNLFLTPYLINKTSTDATWVTTRETVLPARY